MNQKIPKILSNYPMFFLKFKFYLKPKIIVNPNSKLKKIYVIPETYSKYSNILNIHKIFQTRSRVVSKLKQRSAGPKEIPIR